MVDGGVTERIEHALRRISAWRGRPVTAVEPAVRRLCCLATGVATGRGTGAAGGLLERATAWDAGGAGTADRPAAARGSQLSRGAATAGALQRVDRTA